ncbi:MAG TPA: NAD(P)-dependent oxidoreductase [Candidatus Paceibacterota bacterium]|nr:NAD(P)-dependent oxidoreductase [Candidatus Paceibacterota bacterium]
MKITFFEIAELEKAPLTELLPGHELVFYSEKLTAENAALAKDSDVISIFINSQITKELLDLLPNLKLIQTRSTGFDHIDLEAAKAKGIPCSTVPAYGSHTVAEFAFALILTLSRKIFMARHQLMEGGGFNIPATLQGFELKGKTLGVVGTGRIGKNIIKIAKGLEMNVIAHDIYPDAQFAAEQKFEYADLPTLLQQSDIVTLHTPYDEKSHHLINKDNIGLMKKTALFINTARGALVETDALIRALERGDIAGAGLDVLEGERELKDEIVLLKGGAEFKDYKTLFENHVLMDMPNVVLTPHIAFDTAEGVHEILEVTAKDINGFAGGNPVNLL